MKKSLRIGIGCLLTLIYGSIMGLGLTCAFCLHTFFVFGIANQYPRLFPFCMGTGGLALMALLTVFSLNVCFSRKLQYTKLAWFLQTLGAVLLTPPMFLLWAMLIDHLQKVY